MHHHLDERDGRYAHILEMLRVGLPRSRGADLLLFIGIVGVESVAVSVGELDRIFDLCDLSVHY